MASNLTSSGYFQGPSGTLFFEREGSPTGQAILFVHGLGGTTNAYQTLVPDLQKYDLVRFDWAGHGRSAVPSTTSISSYVEDCEAVIAHLGLKSVVAVGHSLGGLVALHLAAKAPQKVKALVLLGPVRPPPEAGQKAMAARAQAVRQGGMAVVADTVVSNAFASESLTRRRGEVALAREMLARQSPEGYALAVDALRTSSAPAWGSIQAKTIILSGEEDKVSTVAVGQTTITDMGSQAQQVRLAGVGHWHMLEAPQACIDAINEAAQ